MAWTYSKVVFESINLINKSLRIQFIQTLTIISNDVLRDWSFAAQDGIKDVVEKSFPSELHRWPVIRAYEAKGYVWIGKYLIIVLVDRYEQFPRIGLIENLPFDIVLDEPSLENVKDWLQYLWQKFSLRPQDFAMIIPVTEGKNIEERWNKLRETDKDLWRKQIQIGVGRHYYHLKGFDLSGEFFIPPGYTYLERECQEFFKDQKKQLFSLCPL